MPSLLPLVQGLYYLATGLWAVLGVRSFQAVTGPKTDVWLVRTVAALTIASGAALVVASRRPRPALETALLGAGSALGLAAVDLVYVARRRISPVYLLDALFELALLGAWPLAWRRAAGVRASR